jgi:hypothetical protein
MRIIIAGSRTFTNYDYLKGYCSTVIGFLNSEDIEIISGGANGADRLGEKFAKEFNYSIKKFPANWNKHGKSAGFIRNNEMIDYAKETDCMVICFWDGKSKGTKHTIGLANKHNIKVYLANFTP